MANVPSAYWSFLFNQMLGSPAHFVAQGLAGRRNRVFFGLGILPMKSCARRNTVAV